MGRVTDKPCPICKDTQRVHDTRGIVPCPLCTRPPYCRECTLHLKSSDFLGWQKWPPLPSQPDFPGGHWMALYDCPCCGTTLHGVRVHPPCVKEVAA